MDNLKQQIEQLQPIKTRKAAKLSDDGVYRYTLIREWGDPNPPQHIVWIGINPSTADAYRDDPTVKKIVMFTNLWGYRRFVLVNLFAYRSSKPEVLYGVDDPIGPDNDTAIVAALRNCSYALCCWGAKGAMFPGRVSAVDRLVRAHDVKTMCIGTTLSGDPIHPLYIPLSAQVRPWDIGMTGYLDRE